VQWSTHRCVSAACAAGVTGAAGIPPSGTVVVLAVAWWTAPTPDRIEPRLGVAHRGPTHYLSTSLLVALLPAVLLTAAVFGLATLADSEGVMRDLRVESDGVTYRGLGEYLGALAVLLGVLVAIGRLCGVVGHTLIDGFNDVGIPIWGPWDKDPDTGKPRRRRLAPKWMCIRSNGTADTILGLLALALTLLLLYVQWTSGGVPSLPTPPTPFSP
jgi:LexA-binding, inner membrane-associated putative hydrolase